MSSKRRARFLVLVFLSGLAAGPGIRTAVASEPDADHRRTESLVAIYQNAPNWVVKAIALLSLGERWHPKGAKIVLDALNSKDRRLQVFGLEALLASPRDTLRAVLSRDVLDSVVQMTQRRRFPALSGLSRVVVAEAFPEHTKVGSSCKTWWRKVREEYETEPWIDRPSSGEVEKRDQETRAITSVSKRAKELSQDGIELVVCIDSTGSMGPTISAASAAVVDIVAILSGLAPDMRVGLVHYRDRLDFGKPSKEGAGAETRLRLTSKTSGLQSSLLKMDAVGGGDLPESVYAGLWHALHRKMGWTAKAHKMVVLIGDAPPHHEDVPKALSVVRIARTDPAWKLHKKWNLDEPKPPMSNESRREKGEPEPFRPILTSCICTGEYRVSRLAEARFRAIARTGGGVFARLTTAAGQEAASFQLVRHLVELTFGEEYREAARLLVETYLFWRKEGYLK